MRNTFCCSAHPFDIRRRNLLAETEKLLRPSVNITVLSKDSPIHLLLYGDQYLSSGVNRAILELTLWFIRESGRFD